MFCDSCECFATVVRDSYECLATFVRVSLSFIRSQLSRGMVLFMSQSIPISISYSSICADRRNYIAMCLRRVHTCDDLAIVLQGSLLHKKYYMLKTFVNCLRPLRGLCDTMQRFCYSLETTSLIELLKSCEHVASL